MKTVAKYSRVQLVIHTDNCPEKGSFKPAHGLSFICCTPYVINDVVHFIRSSAGAGERLDVGRSLPHRKHANDHNKEHLQAKMSSLAPPNGVSTLKKDRIQTKVYTYSIQYTYSDYFSNSVLVTQDERTAVPKGQSVGEVDHQIRKAHGNVSRDRLLYSHVFSILQVLVISFVQHKPNQAWK